MEKERLDYLINELFSDSWEKAVAASDELAEHTESNVVSALVNVLDSNCHYAQNAAALALREIGDNSAVTPLLRAIAKPFNKDNRSTLVYALETLDCSNYFSIIFDLVLSDKWDVSISALNILQEQSFHLSEVDIEEARKKIVDNGIANRYSSAERILGRILKKHSQNVSKRDKS